MPIGSKCPWGEAGGGGDMRNDVECPYCGKGQEINHDDGMGYEENEAHMQECEYCEKVFVFHTSILFYYEAIKAPCANGGEHDWRKITGYPEEHFVGKQRCQVCEEERQV